MPFLLKRFLYKYNHNTINVTIYCQMWKCEVTSDIYPPHTKIKHALTTAMKLVSVSPDGFIDRYVYVMSHNSVPTHMSL